MCVPTSDDPRGALVWENYVVAQTTQATLGLIPASALAVGVGVNGGDVTLRFQLRRLTDADVVDMEDIRSELEALLGQDARVGMTHEIREERHITPRGTRWVFLSRDD